MAAELLPVLQMEREAVLQMAREARRRGLELRWAKQTEREAPARGQVQQMAPVVVLVLRMVVVLELVAQTAEELHLAPVLVER